MNIFLNKNKMGNNNNNKKRPELYTVNHYDYSKIDNLEGCDELPYICPKCLKRDGIMRLGHYHEFIKLPREIRVNPDVFGGLEIKFRMVIVHGHFALFKGTKVPALEPARNCVCDLGTRWANKSLETYDTIHIKNKKPTPDFTRIGE